jgi:hypothetical protein
MDVKSVGFGFVDWLHLTQDRDRRLAFVSTAVNEPSGSVTRAAFLRLAEHLLFPKGDFAPAT